MKKWIGLPLIMVAVISLSACANQQSTVRTKQGAVAGAAVGATAGAIIGHQKGRGLEGAAIGGTIGAAGGATLGSAEDERRQQYF